jgi:hypothetical protein
LHHDGVDQISSKPHTLTLGRRGGTSITGSADGATFHDLGSIDYDAADGCSWKEFALPLGCH